MKPIIKKKKISAFSFNKLINDIKSHRGLIVNFFSLGLVQVTNFIIPLIVYPYLFRTVGVGNFGSISYALNVIIYLSTAIDYGFNLSAPRSIVLIRNETSLLSNFVCKILITKLFIFLFCVALVICALLTIEQVRNDSLLYIYGFIYLIGSCLLPTWLFQGLEDMRHLTWINLLAKVFSTLLIFTLIAKPADYIYVIGLLGLGNLVSGILGLFYAFQKYSLHIRWISLSEIIHELKIGWYYFFSGFLTIIINNSTILILGLFVSKDVLGRYSIAEKITFVIWQLLIIFSQVTYPVLYRLTEKSHQAMIAFIKKSHFPMILFTLTVCIFLGLISNEITNIFTGAYDHLTSLLIKLLLILPVLISLNISAYQILLVYNKQKEVSVIFTIIAIFGLILSYSLTNWFGLYGALGSSIIIQLSIPVALHIFIIKYLPAYSIFKKL